MYFYLNFKSELNINTLYTYIYSSSYLLNLFIKVYGIIFFTTFFTLFYSNRSLSFRLSLSLSLCCCNMLISPQALKSYRNYELVIIRIYI